MRSMVRLARAHMGVAVASGVLVLGGAGAATAAVVTASTDQPVVEQSTPTVESPPVTEVMPPADVPAPIAAVPTAVVEVEAPAVEVPSAGVSAPTLGSVTHSAPAPARNPSPPAAMSVPPGAAPIDPDDPARGGHDADGNYIPAVPVQKLDEPAFAPHTPPPPPEKLQAELGHVTPVG